MKTVPEVDILIIGGGVSGIGCLHSVRQNFPNKTVRVFEGRKNIAGTWDLFNYPGIRSDSDLFTYGFSFNPWTEARSIADGKSIKEYLNTTVDKFNLRKYIRCGVRVVKASWSSETQRWKIEYINELNEPDTFFCKVLAMCTGYYSYEEAYVPEFKDSHLFEGKIVQPQFWPKDLDYANKKVAIIGSGATAVTLVPNMTPTAAHVTMVQRSPTYIAALPAVDPLDSILQQLLPPSLSFAIIKSIKVSSAWMLFWLCRTFPSWMKQFILFMARWEVGPDFDVNKHLTPSYNPWDQRFCICPDGDFFKTLRNKQASIVTGHIDSFSKNGIVMKNGEFVEADLIVLATGLKLRLFGGIQIEVDKVPLSKRNMLSYKGMMMNDLPNFFQYFGYLNASWTLRSDLVAHHMCRILNYMDNNHFNVVKPQFDEKLDKRTQIIPFHQGFSSNYFDRAFKDKNMLFGYCATRHPWKPNVHFIFDMWMLRFSKVNEQELLFST